jgi:hypothetical protein
MVNWFKKKPAVPNGPDFSDINSKDKAEARLQSGDFEKLFLLPAKFGGIDDLRNICYVPHGFVAIKRDIDTNIIKPLIESEKITEYQATPEYQSKIFVPIAIKIVARNPGSFTTDINIWGKALGRVVCTGFEPVRKIGIGRRQWILAVTN